MFQFLLTMEIVMMMALTHSVFDDALFDAGKMFNDPFATHCSPDLASLSSSSEDENVDKQAPVVLPV